MLEDVLSLMDRVMEAKHKAFEDSSREIAKVQREADEAKGNADALRAQLAELQQTSGLLEKELARLKGTNLQGCTLEELTQLEAAVDGSRKRIADAKLAMQIAEQERKQKECVLCMDERKQSVFVPCGHIACCNR